WAVGPRLSDRTGRMAGDSARCGTRRCDRLCRACPKTASRRSPGIPPHVPLWACVRQSSRAPCSAIPKLIVIQIDSRGKTAAGSVRFAASPTPRPSLHGEARLPAARLGLLLGRRSGLLLVVLGFRIEELAGCGERLGGRVLIFLAGRDVLAAI